MGATTEKNPILIVEGIHKIIKDIIGTVNGTVMLWAFDKRIADKQDELEDLKWDFPVEFKNVETDRVKALKLAAAITDEAERDAAIDEARTDSKNRQDGLREKIDAIIDEIETLKITKDKTQLSFLYTLQGIQVAVNNILFLYGVASVNTASIALKGNGGIIMDADESKQVYISGTTNVGSPTGAVMRSLEIVKFGAKIPSFVSKTVKNINEVIEAGKELSK